MSIYTEITRLTAPTGNVFDFPTLGSLLTGYPRIEIALSGVRSATDDAQLAIQCYSSGVIDSGSNYKWETHLVSSVAPIDLDSDDVTTLIQLLGNNTGKGFGNGSGESVGGIIRLDEPLSASRYKRFAWELVAQVSDGEVVGYFGAGLYTNASALEGFKIYSPNTGSIIAGRVVISGMP